MANNNQLIDVQTAKSFIAANWPNDPLLKQIVFNLLDKLPRVDAVKVVHGRWVNAAGGRTICNNCGEYPLYDYFGRQKFSYYCPNCGADTRDGNG